MAVTIDQIKALRDRTGAGIMDCKKALLEVDGDIEKAIDVLREKGIAKAASKAGRIAAEGLTQIKVCDKCHKAVIVEVNCETDFVSSSDKFHDLVNQVLDILLSQCPATLEDAVALTKDAFAEATIAMGEKFVLRRYEIIEAKEGEAFGSYSHMQGKISSLVLLSKDGGDFNKAMAMTVVANNPSYRTIGEVPAEVRERETKIATTEVAEDPKLVNKPENIKAQIVTRKVDKVLSAACLDVQPWVYDENKTVGQVCKENGIEVLKFVRYAVGEGIEKPASEE